MKRLFTFLLLLSVLPSAFSQVSKENVYERGTKTVWLGLDFSRFKFKGEEAGPEKVKEHTVKWNSLILKEDEKYDLEDFFQKEKVTRNIDPTLKTNEELEESELMAESVAGTHRLEEESLKKAVKGYAQEGKEGTLGILFVMEEFNKVKEYGTMHVCFINLGTGELLHSRHFNTEPGGFGFRNYWARTYYNAMRKIQGELGE